MTAPTFSPVRVVLVVLLACVTTWYIGVMAHNAHPTKAEEHRLIQCVKEKCR